MNTYPTFESLGTDPDYLRIGTPEELQAFGALGATPPPSRVSKPRTYKSRYVGVTEHRGRWVSAWETNGKAASSPAFEHSEIGQWRAAYVRMRALGRDCIEVRPESAVRPPTPRSGALVTRGHASRPLGGKRIA